MLLRSLGAAAGTFNLNSFIANYQTESTLYSYSAKAITISTGSSSSDIPTSVNLFKIVLFF